MASGHVNRTKGRTHGCTDQRCNVKIVLVNSEPSTHGTSLTSRDVRLEFAKRANADIDQIAVARAGDGIASSNRARQTDYRNGTSSWRRCAKAAG